MYREEVCLEQLSAISSKMLIVDACVDACEPHSMICIPLKLVLTILNDNEQVFTCEESFHKIVRNGLLYRKEVCLEISLYV